VSNGLLVLVLKLRVPLGLPLLLILAVTLGGEAERQRVAAHHLRQVVDPVEVVLSAKFGLLDPARRVVSVVAPNETLVPPGPPGRRRGRAPERLRTQRGSACRDCSGWQMRTQVLA